MTAFSRGLGNALHQRSVSRSSGCSRQLSVITRAQGKRALITGGNTGIGYETAKALCRQGYDVVIACRDSGRAQAAVAKLKESQRGAQVSSVPLDLGDLSSVRACASGLLDQGSSFDVIVNNAGVMATPKMTTKDGFEFQLGINHLGHFVLTNLLLPSLIDSRKPVRIVNVASLAHTSGKMNFNDLMRDKPGAYEAWSAYGQSKLANILFTYELARKLRDQPQITTNCLHPGLVATELGRYMLQDSDQWWKVPLFTLVKPLFKTPEQGAQTSIFLASSPTVANVTGKYFDNCNAVPSSPASYSTEDAKRLWAVSEELTKVEARVPVAK